MAAVSGVGVRADSPDVLRYASGVALGDGWWRGFVHRGGWPTEFFLEVRRGDGGTRVTMHSELSSWDLAGIMQDGPAVVLPGRAEGEYMRGQLRNGAFEGRYAPGADASEVGGRTFFFRLDPTGRPAPRPGEVWNLSGPWMLHVGDGLEVEALLVQSGGRLHGLIRSDALQPRYFSGELSGVRFALEGIDRVSTVRGRYEPGGVLRGEFRLAGRSVPFVAQRKVAHGAALNLTGRH